MVLESIERGNVTFIEADSTFCLMNQTYGFFNSTDSLPIRQLEKIKQLNADCPSIPGKGNCTCIPEQMAIELREDGTQAHSYFSAKVDCSNLGLTSLPKTLPDNTLTLNVTNNEVSDRKLFRINSNRNQYLPFSDYKLVRNDRQSIL